MLTQGLPNTFAALSAPLAATAFRPAGDSHANQHLVAAQRSDGSRKRACGGVAFAAFAGHRCAFVHVDPAHRSVTMVELTYRASHRLHTRMHELLLQQWDHQRKKFGL